MRRSSRTSVAAASSAAQPETSGADVAPIAPLTRAELRRRAQETVAAPVIEPTTRRSRRAFTPIVVSAEGEALPSIPVEELADLAPEALEIPDLPTEVPLVVETAAASVDTTPVTIPAPPLSHEADSVSVDGDENDVDPFDVAAKLFSFTGETPVQVAASARAANEADATTVAALPTRRRGVSFRRAAAASFSIGVLGVVGLLTVGMTTPLEAVAAAQGTTKAETASNIAAAVSGGDVAGDSIQAYVAPAEVQNEALSRNDDYQTTTIAEMAAESGISNFSNFFVNNPNSPIQWPFAVGVPITYGFGMRSGVMHEGLDFVPGAGSPVQAIADGTVRIATESGGAYGVTVVIDHVIDGELVSSRYAHMQYGALQVVPGQQVTVGTFIGRTGNTGRSFGAHTHFEILAGGTTAIDPLPWLREHAGG